MARFETVSTEQADARAAQLLESVRKSLGTTPNMMATMAQAPAVLDMYLTATAKLGSGSLSAGLREQIALAVAGVNTCTYCASAHTVIGRGAGVADDELARNVNGESTDEQVQAALTFARQIVEQRGFVTDDQVSAVRSAGYTDAQIIEILANVTHNIFTNYFNHIAQTEVDFPKVDVGQPAGV
jgi:uncharacterized peroxidase-related enzyme